MLEAPEDERPDARAQAFGRRGVAGRDGPSAALVEVPAPAEQPAVREVELAPQLVEPVLDRGAGQRHAEVRSQLVGRAGDLAVRVLDRLGLVEDHRVPLLRAQALRVEAQDRVGRERHLRLAVERAPGAVVERGAQGGSEALDLLRPVVQHARGGHHQGAAAQRAERLERLAEAHVVGEQRAEAGVAQRAQPVDAASLVAAQLGCEILGKRRRRQLLRVGEELAQPLERRRRRLLELLAELGQLGEHAAREIARGLAGGQQIGQAPAEAREPVGRQRGEAAAVEGDQRLAGAPGAKHALGLGPALAALQLGAELEFEPRVAGRKTRHERGCSEEGVVGVAAQQAVPAAQPLREAHRLLPLEPHTVPRQQLELVLKPAREQALLVLVAHGHRAAAQRHEAPRVDPGDGRIAVHEGGEHRERLALARDLHGEPWTFAHRAWQAPRAHLHGHAPLESGEHLGQQLGDVIGLEAAAGASQILELAAGERSRCERVQRVAAEGHRVLELLGDRLLARHAQAKAAALVLEHPDPSDGRRRRAHRRAVELHVGALGELSEQRHQHAARDAAAALGAQRLLRSEVPLRGHELRALDAARGHGGERRGERLLVLAAHHHPLEREAGALAGEAVADPAGRLLGPWQRATLAARAAQRDHRRRHVLADVFAAAAVAVPVLVLGKERHAGADEAAPRRDPQGDLARFVALAAHRVRPHQLDASRPGRRAGGAADGFEEPLDRALLCPHAVPVMIAQRQGYIEVDASHGVSWVSR